MTKNTKTLLTIAGVGVVGYIIYNQFMKKKQDSKNFANFNRRIGGGKGTQGMVGPLRPAPRCDMGCVDGRCFTEVFDGNGVVRSRPLHSCSGGGENVRVGQLINA